ncbi:MAG TPA: hypothetical protein VML55_23965 [Planctomycetaceae bacterium]|nr:hypothetical protein [Planctomycetaceae bacterium]
MAAWFIALAFLAIIARHGSHDEMGQIPLHIAAAIAVLTAIGVTLVYRVAR